MLRAAELAGIEFDEDELVLPKTLTPGFIGKNINESVGGWRRRNTPDFSRGRIQVLATANPSALAA